MFSFSVFSVPKWQKRYTLQGDLTTAYISNQYPKKNILIAKKDVHITKKNMLIAKKNIFF